jgi:phospholipid/cholesterol/gamma-HCH transport system ATP-binding protein
MTVTNHPVIVIKDLCKSFGDNHVLRHFGMELAEGENIAVMGKSGSGKSVLIKCIIGLLKQDSGTIRVLDLDVNKLNHHELDQLRAKVGFLFQSNALYDSMTIRENLEFPLRRHWINKEELNVNALVMEALNDVGLPETVDMMPAELSGGMRKRIALARTLILKPKIILYDEPTTGLDPVTGREISNLMVNVQKKYNTSSVIITHDMQCVKISANRIIMLVDGICYANNSFEVLSESTDLKIKQFFE